MEFHIDNTAVYGLERAVKASGNPMRTVIDSSAKENETIFFSAGKVGYQVEVAPADLEKMIKLEYGDIVTE